ncbi:unnamed protein product [Clavelina lepadiformis]|uniref:Uncharacterized protein n=1 Tax=Clavelina lepadiformis TaxID=159417 RepID=A0ABP0FRX8_CLALP
MGAVLRRMAQRKILSIIDSFQKVKLPPHTGDYIQTTNAKLWKNRNVGKTTITNKSADEWRISLKSFVLYFSADWRVKYFLSLTGTVFAEINNVDLVVTILTESYLPPKISPVSGSCSVNIGGLSFDVQNSFFSGFFNFFLKFFNGKLKRKLQNVGH